MSSKECPKCLLLWDQCTCIVEVYNPTQQHILSRIGKLEQKTLVNRHDIDLQNEKFLFQIEDVIKPRLRELERNKTNIATGTYTPDKISHKFEIDLLNRFLKLSYPYLFTDIDDTKLFPDFVDNLNELLGGADLNVEWRTPVDSLNSLRIVECHCSGCAEEA